MILISFEFLNRSYTNEQTRMRLGWVFFFYFVLFFHCVKEVVQIWLSRVRYFYAMDNVLELFTCLLAVVYVIPWSTDKPVKTMENGTLVIEITGKSSTS